MVDVGWLVTNIVAALLLPPLNLVLLGTIGLLLLRRRPRLGRWLMALSLALIYGLSTPYFADRLLASLESPATAMPRVDPKVGAIVVLGGGRYREAPEYGKDTVGRWTLERLRFAARLQRLTGKPILVSGGKPDGGSLSEGQAMEEALINDFKVPVRWVEGASANTRENAVFSARMLKADGISSVYLVTHAWHMPRAQRAFEQAGLHVIPAPTGFTNPRPPGPLDFLPTATALENSRIALHEAIGLVWYRIRGS